MLSLLRPSPARADAGPRRLRRGEGLAGGVAARRDAPRAGKIPGFPAGASPAVDPTQTFRGLPGVTAGPGRPAETTTRWGSGSDCPRPEPRGRALCPSPQCPAAVLSESVAAACRRGSRSCRGQWGWPKAELLARRAQTPPSPTALPQAASPDPFLSAESARVLSAPRPRKQRPGPARFPQAIVGGAGVTVRPKEASGGPAPPCPPQAILLIGHPSQLINRPGRSARLRLWLPWHRRGVRVPPHRRQLIKRPAASLSIAFTGNCWWETERGQRTRKSHRTAGRPPTGGRCVHGARPFGPPPMRVAAQRLCKAHATPPESGPPCPVTVSP